ncbi:MAG: homoserine kinase [Lactobacillales bacterium]|jgi:homoserine kinase|nr:homoserine kinase [Lactobacillales bacterium]
MKIRVPATSANLGPGFDSCGLALDRYLYIEVFEPANEWTILHDLGEDIPSGETNLLVTTALEVVADLKPHRLKMTSEIPLTRGLGSSSSVIVAGIELANQLADLRLTDYEKMQIATKIEGHPDNVAPAILGNFITASFDSVEVDYVKASVPACEIIAIIPDYELATSASRGALPESLDYKDAVKASSRGNLLVAAMIREDLILAGKMMMQDEWHEPYRAALVPELAVVRELVKTSSAFGCALSGAGPTILILTPIGTSREIKAKLAEKLNLEKYEICNLNVDTHGVHVYK